MNNFKKPLLFTFLGIFLTITFGSGANLLQRDFPSLAYGHFFGENVTRDGYQVVFQPFPFAPIAGDNTTLNFSILDEENMNIHNVHSALIIKDKKSNETIAQFPYKQYLYSDLTVPYTFRNNSEYSIILETRIIGDPKYQSQPLTAAFDLIVGDQTAEIFKMIMLYFVTPVCVAIILAILVYELYWKKKRAKEKRPTTK
jgi:hypothetical protein